MSGELTNREVVFGDVTFRIRKLLPMESKQVFIRHVRPLLKGALDVEITDIRDTNESWKVMIAAFTGAPEEHYTALQNALYDQITYKRGKEAELRLRGNEEDAFRDLDMVHSISLDARAFAVNFFDSWGVAQSEFLSLAQDLIRLAPKT